MKINRTLIWIGLVQAGVLYSSIATAVTEQWKSELSDKLNALLICQIPLSKARSGDPFQDFRNHCNKSSNKSKLDLKDFLSESKKQYKSEEINVILREKLDELRTKAIWIIRNAHDESAEEYLDSKFIAAVPQEEFKKVLQTHYYSLFRDLGHGRNRQTLLDNLDRLANPCPISDAGLDEEKIRKFFSSLTPSLSGSSDMGSSSESVVVPIPRSKWDNLKKKTVTNPNRLLFEGGDYTKEVEDARRRGTFKKATGGTQKDPGGDLRRKLNTATDNLPFFDDQSGLTPLPQTSKKRPPAKLPDFLTEMHPASGGSNIAETEEDLKTMEQLQKVILSLSSGSAMITGEAGAGKTELIKSFVSRVKAGKVSGIPPETRFLMLDPNTMQAGTKYSGEFDARLKDLLKIAQEKDTILVIDEAHTLKGAGAHSESSIDFFDKIKTQLSEGKIKIIGITTEDEYNQHFAANSALARRLPKIKKVSPSLEVIPAILANWSSKNKYPLLSEDAYKKITQLSSEYDAVSSNVSRATRLLDKVYVDLKIKCNNDVRCMEKGLSQKEIEEAAAQAYAMDSARFDPEKRAPRIEKLKESLNAIEGNDALKKALRSDAKQVLYGTADKTKPQVRRLLFGPPGTGKTTIAQKYAEGMGLPFKRIMLDTVKTKADLLKNVGDALRIDPFTVILFDEAEKAPVEIQNALLQLMDSNRITLREELGSGKSGSVVSSDISTGNASVFFATNAGGNVVAGAHAKNVKLANSEIEKALIRDNFSKPLLDRMASRHAQLPLSTEQSQDVLRKNLDTALTALNKNGGGYRIHKPDELIEALAKKMEHDDISLRRAIAWLTSAINSAAAKASHKAQKTRQEENKTLTIRLDSLE